MPMLNPSQVEKALLKIDGIQCVSQLLDCFLSAFGPDVEARTACLLSHPQFGALPLLVMGLLNKI